MRVGARAATGPAARRSARAPTGARQEGQTSPRRRSAPEGRRPPAAWDSAQGRHHPARTDEIEIARLRRKPAGRSAGARVRTARHADDQGLAALKARDSRAELAWRMWPSPRSFAASDADAAAPAAGVRTQGARPGRIGADRLGPDDPLVGPEAEAHQTFAFRAAHDPGLVQGGPPHPARRAGQRLAIGGRRRPQARTSPGSSGSPAPTRASSHRLGLRSCQRGAAATPRQV